MKLKPKLSALLKGLGWRRLSRKWATFTHADYWGMIEVYEDHWCHYRKQNVLATSKASELTPVESLKQHLAGLVKISEGAPIP